MNKKKVISLIVRIIISIVLLYFLLKQASLTDITSALLKADHKLMFLGIALYILGQVLSAYKWKILAEAIGFKNKTMEYFDYYFIGMFFNLFLPTTVGGDVAKCYYLSENDDRDRRSPAIYSVLADRYSGVAVIVWMATIAMFTPMGSSVAIGYKLFMLAMSVLILIISPTFTLFMHTFFKRKKWVRTMLKDTKVYFNDPKLIIKVLTWSLVFHCIVISIHIVIATAIGIKIPPQYFFIIYPMSAMAGFIPVAFNGLGPREAAYIIFFGYAGINHSQSMAFSIVWFATVLIASLTGILFYIKGKHTPVPEEFDFIEEIEEEDSDEDELNVDENDSDANHSPV